MRKQFFNDKENGYLKTEKPKSAQKNPMQGTFNCVYNRFMQIIDSSVRLVLCILLDMLKYVSEFTWLNQSLHITGLTGNILVGEWQIALLVHFRRVMECCCKSTLKICQLEFYLTSFTNAKFFPSFTGERKVFDYSKYFFISNEL